MMFYACKFFVFYFKTISEGESKDSQEILQEKLQE